MACTAIYLATAPTLTCRCNKNGENVMRIILAIGLLLAGCKGQAFSQTFLPSDSPNITVQVETPASGSVFFAASGNDSNPCTQAQPCQSLSRASSFIYQPGQSINFNGGDTFPGELHI